MCSSLQLEVYIDLLTRDIGVANQFNCAYTKVYPDIVNLAVRITLHGHEILTCFAFTRTE